MSDVDLNDVNVNVDVSMDIHVTQASDIYLSYMYFC